MIEPSGHVADDGSYLYLDTDNLDKYPLQYLKINVGDKIHLHFAGGPNDMPEPWILVKAVDKGNNPSVIVRAANGTERTYDNAQWYSPCPQSQWDKHVEYMKERGFDIV